MKKISLGIVLVLMLSVPVTAHAMSLGDVLTQYSIYMKEAASALKASAIDAMSPSKPVPAPKPAITPDQGTVLIKALAYTAKSPTIITEDLKKGAKNSDQVRKLQLFLISKGYLSADPTGTYGDLTTAALKKFQAAKGIKSDGTIVGPLTRAAISSEVLPVTTTDSQ